MPSAALNHWQNDRVPRLNAVDSHCATVLASIPPDPAFVDETLRGFVLHLSAHFQGFCRNLYMECSQVLVARIPVGLQTAAQLQFSANLALEKGNPSYENIKRDFGRFGFHLDLQAAQPFGSRRVTDLGHLNEWRNRAAHQGTHPLKGGVPNALSLGTVRDWMTTCDGLADSLDDIMRLEMHGILGAAPW